MLWYFIQLIHVSRGIEGLDTFTAQHFQAYRRQSVEIRQTEELSKEDEVPPLEFPVSEIQREEEEFEDQIPDVLEDTESPLKKYLKFLLTKGDELCTKKWYKKARSIKLLPGTFR